MKRSKRIDAYLKENAWRNEWIAWVRSIDRLHRVEMDFCRDAYQAGWKAGRSLDEQQ